MEGFLVFVAVVFGLGVLFGRWTRRPGRAAVERAATPSDPFQAVLEAWPRIIDAIRKESYKAVVMYDDTRPVSLTGSTLTLEFPWSQSFRADQARHPTYVASLERAVRKVCGLKVDRVRTVFDESDELPPPKDEPRPAPKPAPRSVPKPAPKPTPKPEPKPAPRPEPKPAPRPQPRPAPRGGGGRANSANRPWDTDGGVFKVRRVKDTLTLANGDEEAGSLILISGSITARRAKQRVAIITRLLDITDGDGDEALPVLCGVAQFRDDDGEYVSVRTDTLPHREVGFDDYTAAIVPDERIHAARRGQRRFRVIVAFADADDHDDILAIGWGSYSYTERDVGYEEWGQLESQLERHVADIGLAAAAADGQMDRAELELIRDYFSERLRRRDEAERLKSEVSAHLRETVAALRAKQRTPSQVIREAAKALREDAPARRAAFELAVQVVAVDDEVGGAEDAVLTEISSALDLDEPTVRELRDKVIRIEMLTDVSEEALLGVPAGLSRAEKLEWISKEYYRWQNRVNNPDPEKRQEAEARVKRLGKLRQQLQDGA